MSVKKTVCVVLVLLFTVSFLPVTAHANACAHGKKADQSLDEKILCKAHFLLDNQEELALSDDQADKIKTLKVEVKKELIRKDAEIEILAVDIKAKLYADTIDVEGINKLVDKKYDLKKERTKYLVGKYAEIKNIPTKEQTDKIKSLWKKCGKK